VFLPVGALLLMNAAPARADILVTLTGTAPGGPGVTVFTYSVSLRPASELDQAGGAENDYSAGNPAGNQVNPNSNNFFTLYDVVGFVPGSLGLSPSLAALFAPGSITMQDIGMTPFAQIPPDAPGLINITFNYTLGIEIENPGILPDLPLGTFHFDSTGIPGGKMFYSAATQKNVADPDEDEEIANNTSVVAGPKAAAIIPEPATVVLLGIGAPMAAAFALRRRRRK
jgi:hypothetical protein